MPETEEKSRVPVLVELRVKKGAPAAIAHEIAARFGAAGFAADPDYHPVPVRPAPADAAKLAAAGEEVVVVHGHIDAARIAKLKAHPDVVRVWNDTPISPFGEHPARVIRKLARSGPCPIKPCDCSAGSTSGGTMQDVAKFLGADQIWAAGHRGSGIVIGIVDGGICAIGRTPQPGEVARVPNVTGGFPDDWGTTGVPTIWGNHGNMTAIDALGVAPDAKIYDIRISGGTQRRDRIRHALAGFEWAIKRHRADGTPHVLSCSWGIWQQTDDSDYATDPHHPFTRKVVEAIDAGITVLFAAGNCGAACPDDRCSSDIGPGRAIWGANGHPQVMTIGAVNLKGDYVGYSSPGPAALDPQKPDFCLPTQFACYFPKMDPDQKEACDAGTSSATAIAAGVVALIKQRRPGLTPDQIKAALKRTARDIGPPGFDQFTGAGIVRAKAAWDCLA